MGDFVPHPTLKKSLPTTQLAELQGPRQAHTHSLVALGLLGPGRLLLPDSPMSLEGGYGGAPWWLDWA